MHQKKRVEENANHEREFFETQTTTPALVCGVLHTVIDWDRTWTLVSHAWVDWVSVHSLTLPGRIRLHTSRS